MADRAGYETSPVLLFYGLSQAGRAITAAYAGEEELWELLGHGITCPNINEVEIVGDLRIKNGRVSAKPASFTTVAERLGSPSLPSDVKMRELWKSLPEAANAPLSKSLGLYSALHLQFTEVERADDEISLSPRTSRCTAH
jgi:hypothetical protein